MVIRPNSRQIPSSLEYTSSKLYHDLLYAYLQSLSLPGDRTYRYVPSNLATHERLAEVLGVKRLTAGKYLKGLQELELVGAKEKGKYKLPVLPSEFAYLVPNDVLIELVNSKIQYIVSIYVFFCMLSFNQREITFSMAAVKNVIGVSTTNYHNSQLVNGALEYLESLGLLKLYTKYYVKQTIKVVSRVTNEIQKPS